MIEVPKLDTIAFEDLVDEGRGLIPRYAPDWTDHNLHDPGITLLDLLAWFVDQQVYRIGFIGDAHLDAFAALLGVKRKAAAPARGLIWPRAGALTDDQTLAAGTRAKPVEQTGLAFSVTHAIALSAATLSITAHRPQDSRLLKVGDDGAIRLHPDTETLEIEFDPPLVPPGDVGEGEDARPAHFALGLAYGGPLPTAAGASAPVAIDYLDGEGIWHRAAPAWTGAAGAASGAALLLVPPEHGPVPRLRLRLDAGLPRRLLPTRIALNAVPIVQIETLPKLKIGEGQDWPDLEIGFDFGDGSLPEAAQGFRPLVIRSRDRRGVGLEWTAVADFSRSGPADRHYVVDQGRGAIIFGNGINGRFPEREDEISRDPLDVTHGARGNLAAALDWTMSFVDIPDRGPFGRNLAPIAGGSDAWSREDLLTELRRRARRRKAMLTDGDLLDAAHALNGYGIDRAEVLARVHPALPGRAVPGARTLLLRAGEGVAANDAWLGAVDRALAPRRVLGERLAVVAVSEVPVAVAAELLVAAGSDRDRIDREARQRLCGRLAVRASEDPQIEPWPSGRPVTVGELETLLAGVDGVVAVTGLRLARADAALAMVSLPLARTEVAVAADERISISFRAGG